MTGEPNDPGILPRCLDVVFNSIQHLQAKKYVSVRNPTGLHTAVVGCLLYA